MGGVSIAFEEVKSSIPELENYYREFPEIFQNEMNNALDHAARSGMKRFQNTRLRGPYGTNVLAKGGRGSLFRRFQRRADLKSMAIQVRTASTAAIGLEEGANINSSKGMPVPLSFNRFMFDGKHRLIKKYRAMLNKGELTDIQSKGNEYLGQIDKHTKKFQPLFIIKHNIRIKKMLGFADTFDSHKDRIFSILENAMENTLIKANDPNYVMKPFKTTAKKWNANG
ncbi:MAG: hypothetical protein WC373_04960 [Smithella sp.]|jgi:hypothetical protein